MKHSTQRLTAATVLVLLCIGAWWLGREVPVVEEKAGPALATSADILPLPRPPMMAQNGTVKLEEPRQKHDQYAGRVVIDEKETLREVNGVKLVKRVRLVRDPSFKYSIVRVEDELVRGPQGDRLTRQIAMVGDHVLVKPVDRQMSEAELLKQIRADGATIRKRMPSSGNLLIAFPEPTVETVPYMVAQMSRLKALIEYAEPDYIMSTNALPNDASFGSLWGMHNTGQSSGVADADIDAPEAWELTTGSAAVKVAVIDSGIDLTHPDLLDNLWTNPDEVPNNGLDDDGNGYVDDVRGWDFVNDDATPNDDNGHGTHCAGTVGAVGNNGAGVTGVCWDVSLIGLKFLNSAGNGALSDGVEAIAYATDVGVAVTSNSWSGGDYSQAMKDVIDAAGTAGILFIAAAGNDGSYLEFYPAYPASYTSTNLISVAATTRQDGLADFSNYGPVSADLGAPGLDVLSCVPGGGYGLNSGTSMACPHVSGVAALLKSLHPALTAANIRTLLFKSVDLIPALTNKTVTGGRLNLYNALLASDDVLVAPGNGLIATGELGGPFAPSQKVYTITNETQSTANWNATADQPWVSLSPASGILSAGESMTLTVSLNAQVNDLPAGTQTATVTLTNQGTGRTQLRPVAVQVNSVPIYQFNLDTDPGWPRTGEWAWGVPQGAGGTAYGRADPKSGATGTNVLGINLAGDYSTQIGQAQYVTAGPFDLSAHRNARLRFQRWLNSDYQTWVYATVAISTNGSTWTTIWNNGTTPYGESAWTPVEYDIATYADGQPQVYIRWGHQVSNFGSYPYSGWNVDDIVILGTPKQQLFLTLPASVTEGGPSGQAKITVSPGPPTDLTVTLTSNRPDAQLTLPATVIIPAGQEEVTFAVSALQDSLADGSQAVTITTAAPDYPVSVAAIQVHDDEQAQITLTLPATLQEGSGEITNQATVNLNGIAAADIVIQLHSTDTTELQVPATITLPTGQDTVSLPLIVPDDVIIDGTQPVTVTASVLNWPAAEGSLTITDNEPLNLTLTLPDKRVESAGVQAAAGSVSTAGNLASVLTILLVSSDPTELTVPATVTIPAGSSTATFDLSFQDDALSDGDQTVTVTFSSPGFIGGSTAMIVTDDEVPALPTQPSPADGQNPTPPDTALAWQYDPHSGGIPESYQIYFGNVPEPVELLGTTASPSWSLPLPGLRSSTTYYWRIVTRRGAATRQGPVWRFTTPPVGPLHGFVWDATPPAVAQGVPFPVRVTAVDEYGLTLSRYDRQTPFTAVIEQPETTTGTGTYPWYFPLATNYHDARTQSIYTPAEVGPAGKITALAFEIQTPPGQPLTNFNIRLRHTTKTDYLSGGLTWETEDWTPVSVADQTLSTPGWTWFTFTTPFEYDGSSNLMVDFSFNNTGYSTDGSTRTTITADYRTLAYRTDSVYGDPLTWSANYPDALAYNGLPNLRLRRAAIELPLSPETSGPYNQASWSGQITLLSTGQALRLKAKDPENPDIFGLSAPLNVLIVDDFTLNAEPLFTGGLSNMISGSALSNGYEYEIQRAGQPDFSDAASSGFIGTPNHQFGQLTDGKLYHYRGRARLNGAAGKWSSVERSTQDATPPSILLGQPGGGVTSLSTVNLSGTATDTVSGVSSLTVNDIISITDDSYNTWNTPSLTVAEGLNTFTIKAADKAVPPNVRTVTWLITRISDPDADADANGVPALLEYAFNATGNSPVALLPTLTTAKHEETQKSHLILSYRRLIQNPSQLIYTVETSPNLEEWQPVETTAETLSATATGDGVTELVKVRINPAIEGQSRGFARVKVETSTP